MNTAGNARDYLNGTIKGTFYIHTAWGYQEIGWINNNYQIHCPKDNGGFGMTYYCHAGTSLYSRTEQE